MEGKCPVNLANTNYCIANTKQNTNTLKIFRYQILQNKKIFERFFVFICNLFENCQNDYHKNKTNEITSK